MIDKRIPFGFLGEWGKVYKLYNHDTNDWINTTEVSVNETISGADYIIFKSSDKYLKLYINDTLKKTINLGSGERLNAYKFTVNNYVTKVEFKYNKNTIQYRINMGDNIGEWQTGDVELTGQIIDPAYLSRLYPIKMSYETQALTLVYQESNYVDIGQDVQFKCVGDRTFQYTQPVKNLAADSEFKQIMTGDATYDNGRYKCVVAVGDIVYYDSLYWVVEKLNQEEVYYPNEQAVWVLSIKRIYEEILTGA